MVCFACFDNCCCVGVGGLVWRSVCFVLMIAVLTVVNLLVVWIVCFVVFVLFSLIGFAYCFLGVYFVD